MGNGKIDESRGPGNWLGNMLSQPVAEWLLPWLKVLQDGEKTILEEQRAMRAEARDGVRAVREDVATLHAVVLRSGERTRVACPCCRGQFFSDQPLESLSDRILTLLADSPGIYYTLSSIADCLQIPEASVLKRLRELVLSRIISGVQHGPAVVYEHHGNIDAMLEALDDEGPMTARALRELAWYHPSDSAGQHLAQLVEDGLVVKEGKIGAVTDIDLYRAVPVELLE